MKKSDRLRVWNKYRQRCAYCGKHLLYHEMQVDHVIPRMGGRRPSAETFDNFMPSCRRCNHYKRSHTLEHFRRLLLTLDNRINDYYINRVAIDYGIISKVVPWDGVFYFEKHIEPIL